MPECVQVLPQLSPWYDDIVDIGGEDGERNPTHAHVIAQLHHTMPRIPGARGRAMVRSLIFCT